MGRAAKTIRLTQERHELATYHARLAMDAPRILKSLLPSTAAAVRTLGEDEIVSLACQSLVKAAGRWEDGKGRKFESYAIQTMIWDVLDESIVAGHLSSVRHRKGNQARIPKATPCDNHSLRFAEERQSYIPTLDIDEDEALSIALDAVLPRDRPVAVALVRDGQPIQAAGAAIGMSRQTAFNAGKRVVRVLRAMLYYDDCGLHLVPREEETPRDVAAHLMKMMASVTGSLTLSWHSLLEKTLYTPDSLREGLKYRGWFMERTRGGVWCRAFSDKRRVRDGNGE